ncbi:DUF4231 domain-containing protein [Mesorhizobium sp. 1B3]|uniref:DUF4231 domain-containing protein n=1 Tax=Mesorhizobium sp. 1B3 TaxID=3243599 RepID=UPI003D99A942
MPDTEQLKGNRLEKAQHYLDNDLHNQRSWYSARSSSYKFRTQVLAFSIIAAGSATTFAQLFKDSPWVPIITAALGAYIALAEGWQRISRYGETWLTYRMAAEKIKREQRLYINAAGAYRGLNDEDAFVHFVEGVESIVAEEQQIYWQSRHLPNSAVHIASIQS